VFGEIGVEKDCLQVLETTVSPVKKIWFKLHNSGKILIDRQIIHWSLKALQCFG
jgi:hypothetical protein